MPAPDNDPSADRTVAARDLEAVIARKRVDTCLKKNFCNSRVWWSR
jgi:hypothetical protein